MRAKRSARRPELKPPPPPKGVARPELRVAILTRRQGRAALGGRPSAPWRRPRPRAAPARPVGELGVVLARSPLRAINLSEQLTRTQWAGELHLEKIVRALGRLAQAPARPTARWRRRQSQLGLTCRCRRRRALCTLHTRGRRRRMLGRPTKGARRAWQSERARQADRLCGRTAARLAVSRPTEVSSLLAFVTLLVCAAVGAFPAARPPARFKLVSPARPAPADVSADPSRLTWRPR